MTPIGLLLGIAAGFLVALSFRQPGRPRRRVDVLLFRAYSIGMATWVLCIIVFHMRQPWTEYTLGGLLVAISAAWLLARRIPQAV
jgi:hypothetical protein